MAIHKYLDVTCHSVSPVQCWGPSYHLFKVGGFLQFHRAHLLVTIPDASNGPRVHIKVRCNVFWAQPETELHNNFFDFGVDVFVGAKWWRIGVGVDIHGSVDIIHD
jgi:hypothetical protein